MGLIEGAVVFDAVQLEGDGQVRVDRSRDALLTDLSRATLEDTVPKQLGQLSCLGS